MLILQEYGLCIGESVCGNVPLIVRKSSTLLQKDLLLFRL